MNLQHFVTLALLSACGPRGDTDVDTDPQVVDADGDGHPVGADCDDQDPLVHPGAPERCDGADQDCDREVDEDPTDAPVWFQDDDRDGYGVDALVVDDQCQPPDGFAGVSGDCAPGDPAVFPGAEEVCWDARDNDCAPETRADCTFGQDLSEESAHVIWSAQHQRCQAFPWDPGVRLVCLGGTISLYDNVWAMGVAPRFSQVAPRLEFVLGDFVGDAATDLVTADGQVVEGPLQPGAKPRPLLDMPDATHLARGDVNADGKDDLVLVVDGTAYVLVGPLSPGPLSDRATGRFPASDVWSLWAADVSSAEGDEIIVQPASELPYMVETAGREVLAKEDRRPWPADIPRALFRVGAAPNGRAWLVTNRDEVYQGWPENAATPPIVTVKGQSSLQISGWGDLNHDGSLDLAASENKSVRVLWGPLPSTIEADQADVRITLGDFRYATDVLFADMDGDLRNDLLLLDYFDRQGDDVAGEAGYVYFGHGQ